MASTPRVSVKKCEKSISGASVGVTDVWPPIGDTEPDEACGGTPTARMRIRKAPAGVPVGAFVSIVQGLACGALRPVGVDESGRQGM
jgi:hypothetical protein